MSQTPTAVPRRSLTVSLGASQGRYAEDVTNEYGSSGLALGLSGYRTYKRRMSYHHAYTVAGGNVAYQFRPGPARGIHTIGLGIWAGRELVGYRPLAPGAPFEARPPDASTRLGLFDFNPYVEGRFGLGRLAVGYRAGLHIGQLRNGASTLADSSLANTWLAPDAQLWVGVRRVLFAQFDSGVGQLALGNLTSRIGLGTGLGSDNERYLLAGMAVATHDAGEAGYNMGFLSANVPLGHTGFSFEPYAASNFNQHYRFNLLMHYQLSVNIAQAIAPK